MKRILLALLAALLAFTLASFVELTPDFGQWERQTREVTVFGWLLIGFVHWVAYEVSLEKRLEREYDERKSMD